MDRLGEDSDVALKIELKPNERVILGDCVVTNADQRTRLVIEGAVPILREKDIMTLSRADSPAKRIYLAVQLMYTSKQSAGPSRTLSPAGPRYRDARHPARGLILTASIIES